LSICGWQGGELTGKVRGIVLLLGGLVGVAVTLSGCTGRLRAWTTQDSWYRAPPPGLPGRSEWAALEPSAIHPVVDASESLAEALLAQLPIVELGHEEAAQLVGGTLPQAPGTQPYLVRGVCLNRSTGSFSAFLLEGRLWVHHASLGRRAVPMKRQVLVLQLERRPAEVFVTCSMAE
jgi:hypothetical protein